MSGIDYLERIPNNVDLASNRRLLRALEEWQPKFLDWWQDMGPEGLQARDIYLRTAVSVDAQGWAQFGYLKMPEYRWGIFLAEPEPNRVIAFGDHKGQPAWQDVPGEHRATLRRLKILLSSVSGPPKRSEASMPVSASGENAARASMATRTSSSQSMSSGIKVTSPASSAPDASRSWPTRPFRSSTRPGSARKRLARRVSPLAIG